MLGLPAFLEVVVMIVAVDVLFVLAGIGLARRALRQTMQGMMVPPRRPGSSAAAAPTRKAAA